MAKRVVTIDQSLENITIPFNFTPRIYQLAVYDWLDSGNKKVFCRWTRRAGKDVCFWNFMIKKAFERVGNYYYVFPNYSQGKKAIWEGKTKAQYQYLNYIPPQLLLTKNSNEMSVTLINGSTIRIVGSENIDSLRGAGPCGIVISEFAYHTGGMQVLEVLGPMLNENDGWLLINSTPKGKNFMYDFEQTIAKDPNWLISEIQSLWPDLPNYYPVYTSRALDERLSSGEIGYAEFYQEAIIHTNAKIDEERKMGKDEEFIEQEYGVSYVAGQKGAYYSDCIIRARKENRIGKYPPDMRKPVDVFLDLGVSDDTAIWFRQIDHGRIQWIEYVEDSGKDLYHYAQLLKSKGYNYRYMILPHDGGSRTRQTAMTDKQLLQRMFKELNLPIEIHVAKKPTSKQMPINLTRERFPKYYFNEDLTNDGITKLSLYHREYDKRNQCFRETPAHDWCSHAADALSLDGWTEGQFGEATYFDPINAITDFNPLDY